VDETQFIFDTSDGVMALDGDQRITLWNGGSYALLGFKPEDVIGRYCYEVLKGRDESGRLVCQAHCRDIMAMRRQELVRNHDMLVRTKGGRELWMNVSTIRVPSRRKDLTVLVHLFRDASRQKEMERFVKNLLAGVEKLSSFRGAASATASSDSPNTESLTNREREVLRLLFSGSSTETIAHKLGISPATARNHITNILGKLDVHSRLEAVTLALRNGVI
jgi:PAS domain S-box-containing protein